MSVSLALPTRTGRELIHLSKDLWQVLVLREMAVQVHRSKFPIVSNCFKASMQCILLCTLQTCLQCILMANEEANGSLTERTDLV